jgi:hypothetical protein
MTTVAGRLRRDSPAGTSSAKTIAAPITTQVISEVVRSFTFDSAPQRTDRGPPAS